MKDLICPECGRGAKIIESRLIYRADYGPLYACEAWPECDAYVGVHRGTLTPLGTLAGPTLRGWRRMAHEAFDPLWRTGGMGRREAYRWLQDTLNIPHERAHIAMLTKQECRTLIAAACAVMPPAASPAPERDTEGEA